MLSNFSTVTAPTKLSFSNLLTTHQELFFASSNLDQFHTMSYFLNFVCTFRQCSHTTWLILREYMTDQSSNAIRCQRST